MKKDQRDKTKLDRYVPNPGFQEEFFKSAKSIRAMICGNQAGKTHGGAVEAAHYALGTHPHKKIRTPNVGIISTAMNFKDGIEDIVLPKLRAVVGSKDITKIKNNSQGIPVTIHWRSGSLTHLKSVEQDDESYEGKTIDWAWLDEPHRRAIFIALKRGMLTTAGHTWMTMTPLSEPWIYEEIYIPGKEGTDPNIEIFEGSSDQNFRISKSDKDEFLSRLTKDEIQTRWHGKFQHLAGRVFKEYQRERHRIKAFDVPYHWPVWISIDPHRNKPNAVVFLAVAPDGKRYVCNEIYHACGPKELANLIKEVGSQYNVVETLIDTSAQESGWEKVSLRQLLQDYDVRTKLAQKKNLKNSGIILINQGFMDNELFIMEHCIRIHREFTNQIYTRNKRDASLVLEEPKKAFDD